MIERIPELVNGDEWLVWRGRFLNVDFMIEVSDVPYYVSIQSGRITSLERGPFFMRSWRFAIRASAEAWRSCGSLCPAQDTQTSWEWSSVGRLALRAIFSRLWRTYFTSKKSWFHHEN